MKKPVFTGAAVAIVTPFNKDGVDFNKLEELIEFQIRNKIDAILICGTTGEASTMPDDEHKEAIRFAVEKAAKRVPVIAGTGSNDTAHAVQLSRFAESAGADAILSVTPYYNKTTQPGLIRHFTEVADCIKIPVILYNVPGRTGMNIEPETLKALSKIDNIAGIKECNLLQAGEVAALCGNSLFIYSGIDDQILPMLSVGGKGVISVMANIAPLDLHNLVTSFHSGDIEESRRIQLQALDLISALFTEVNPIPIKAAMNLMGMNVGKCRLPLVDISEKGLDILKAAMKAYGLI